MTITKNWAVHPGIHIKEEMEERGWIQRDLAFILGCKEQAVNPILSGKRGISPEMAKALANTFDVPAEFFLNLQKNYELALAQEPSPGVAIRANMQSKYPVREMIKRGWLEDTDANLLEAQITRFFGVKSVDQVPYLAHAAMKSSYEEREIPPLQLAWLFRIRQVARSISVPSYSQKCLRDAVTQLQEFMISPEDTSRVAPLLAECGIRLVAVEPFAGGKIDGVCLWLDGVNPVIGMSTRYDRIDNFWFVLRHEIEHVLNGDGKEVEILDDLDGERAGVIGLSEEEILANRAALSFCVPSDKLDSFILRKQPYFSEKAVQAFASLVQRHPGIVVGQLQHRLKNYSLLRKYQSKTRVFFTTTAVTDGWGQIIQTSL